MPCEDERRGTLALDAHEGAARRAAHQGEVHALRSPDTGAGAQVNEHGALGALLKNNEAAKHAADAELPPELDVAILRAQGGHGAAIRNPRSILGRTCRSALMRSQTRACTGVTAGCESVSVALRRIMASTPSPIGAARK